MKKELQGIVLAGAPWGGPETQRYASCFASMVMAIEKLPETTPIFCTQGPGYCKLCGRCENASFETKLHGQLHFECLMLSGFGAYTVWQEDLDGKSYIDLPLVVKDDRYIGLSMEYSGYHYQDVREDPDAVWEAAVASIDRGYPALAYRLAGDDWCLITGYDTDGRRLSGTVCWNDWDEQYPGETDAENRWFSLTDWQRVGQRLLAVTGKKTPRVDYDELLLRFAGLLEDPQAEGCISGFKAYDAIIKLLENDSYFEQASPEELNSFYGCLYWFIGTLAGYRCYISLLFLSDWNGKIKRGKNDSFIDLLHVVAGYFMNTHNSCWELWAIIGKNHICEPEKYLHRLSDRKVRQEAISILRQFRHIDEISAKLLRDCKDIKWFQLK